MKVKKIDITPKRLAVCVGIIALIVILLIAVINLSGRPSREPEFLISDSDLYLMQGNKSCAKITSILVGDANAPGALEVLTSRIFYSEDGKYMYFSDNADPSSETVTYYVVPADLKDPAKKLDTNISKIVPAGNGNAAFYLKGGSLMKFSPSDESSEIASDVCDFSVSDNAKIISFMKNDNSLWIKNNSKDSEKLDINISELCSVTDKGIVYYSKNEVLYSAKQIKYKEPEINNICSGLSENCFMCLKSSDNFYFITYSSVNSSGDVKINEYAICYFDGKKVSKLQESVDVSTIKLAPDKSKVAFVYADDQGSKLGVYRGKKAVSTKLSATDIITFSKDSKTVYAKSSSGVIKSRC